MKTLLNFLRDGCKHDKVSRPMLGDQVCLHCGMRRAYVIPTDDRPLQVGPWYRAVLLQRKAA